MRTHPNYCAQYQNVMFCAIWYHLYNLRGEVTLSNFKVNFTFSKVAGF